MFIYNSLFVQIGKQRHIKLLQQSVIEGHDTEPFKIAETKGCHIFCHGEIRQPHGGSSCCLCVAIKRTVQVYEINKTKQKYRKMKDIQASNFLFSFDVIVLV